MARFLFLVSLFFAGVSALTAPTQKRAVAAKPVVAPNNKMALQVAAASVLAPVLAAAPANAFASDYLPAILVPVMTLFLPAIGMGLSFILVDKNEI